MLPTLCDPITVRAILAKETAILDLAATILADAADYDDEEIGTFRDHHSAVLLANDLACLHDTQDPSDKTAFDAACQLKVWHLLALDCWIASITPDDHS